MILLLDVSALGDRVGDRLADLVPDKRRPHRGVQQPHETTIPDPKRVGQVARFQVLLGVLGHLHDAIDERGSENDSQDDQHISGRV